MKESNLDARMRYGYVRISFAYNENGKVPYVRVKTLRHSDSTAVNLFKYNYKPVLRKLVDQEITRPDEYHYILRVKGNALGEFDILGWVCGADTYKIPPFHLATFKYNTEEDA